MGLKKKRASTPCRAPAALVKDVSGQRLIWSARLSRYRSQILRQTRWKEIWLRKIKGQSLLFASSSPSMPPTFPAIRNVPVTHRFLRRGRILRIFKDLVLYNILPREPPCCFFLSPDQLYATDLARARLMIDARFGMVGRLWPRKYW